ncbi:hypothetical protein TNCV_2528901 [Trichonephila clavipes]|nr:hypothetical protein TNCV_2528901 [Trichonephila clavipes]
MNKWNGSLFSGSCHCKRRFIHTQIGDLCESPTSRIFRRRWRIVFIHYKNANHWQLNSLHFCEMVTLLHNVVRRVQARGTLFHFTPVSRPVPACRRWFMYKETSVSCRGPIKLFSDSLFGHRPYVKHCVGFVIFYCRRVMKVMERR